MGWLRGGSVKRGSGLVNVGVWGYISKGLDCLTKEFELRREEDPQKVLD